MNRKIKLLVLAPILLTFLIESLFYLTLPKEMGQILFYEQIWIWLVFYFGMLIGCICVYYLLEKKVEDSIILRIGELRALAGMSILIPLLLFVWVHSVGGYPLDVVIILSIVLLAIYFLAIYYFYIRISKKK